MAWSDLLRRPADEPGRRPPDEHAEGDRSRGGQADQPTDPAPGGARRSARTRRGHRGPAIPGRPERRQRLEPGHPLVQPLELGPAGGAALQVLPGRRIARLEPGLAEAQQCFHRQMGHAPTPSPSQRRSRWCARASWDFEKLGVLPIMAAISSCV